MMNAKYGNACSGPHAVGMKEHGLRRTMGSWVKGRQRFKLVWAVNGAGHNAWAVDSNFEWWRASCSGGNKPEKEGMLWCAHVHVREKVSLLLFGCPLHGSIIESIQCPHATVEAILLSVCSHHDHFAG